MGPYRISTVVTGAVCGLALATGTMLVGAIGPTPAQWLPGTAAPGPSVVPDLAAPPLTGRQPEVAAAMLADGDVPALAAATRPPARGGTDRHGTDPAGDLRTGAATTPARCRALFHQPSELLPENAQSRATRELHRGASRLRQTVVVLGGNPDGPAAAVAAVAAFRETATWCGRFSAETATGPPVRVRTARATAWPAGDEGFGVRFIDRTGGAMGWLGVARVGPAVTVLHTVGPYRTPEHASARHGPATLRLAADKLRLLTG